MSDIILRDSDILNKEFNFKDKIEIATQVATTLKEVITTQKLAVNIQGNQYITAEGWNCLGTMLGTYARTEWVEKIEKGYKARVSICQGDNILSTAEAIATRGGFQKTEYAIYSMAQTRAMGKAYRMAFSWIVKLAGYQPTPAEEMEMPYGEDMYTSEPSFTTADKVEPISIDPVAENWIKTLCVRAKAEGKPCRKGVLIACAKSCEKLSQEEKKQVIDYIRNLPDGEVDLDD